MIKMLVLDIDGTIYRKDFSASQAVKNALRTLTNEGIKVVLATGRMFSATIPIAKDIGLTSPIVCYQGGFIKECSEAGKVLLQKDVPEQYAREIIDILREKDIHCNLYMDDGLVVENDNETIKRYTDERNVRYSVVESFNNVDLKNINKMLAIDTDTKKIEDLQKQLSEKYSKDLYIIRSTPNFCEISNIEATKGNAIRYLSKLWNIKKEEIMAVGDQDNDIEMLKAAGIAVAMGNGTEELKKIADYVTDTVENDGVVKAIQKFIKEKI